MDFDVANGRSSAHSIIPLIIIHLVEQMSQINEEYGVLSIEEISGGVLNDDSIHTFVIVT